MTARLLTIITFVFSVSLYALLPSDAGGEKIEYWEGGTSDRRIAPIGYVHTHGLFHRGVHIFAIAPASGHVLLQLRSSEMRSCPGTWNVVGEHHAPHESDATCASRAFSEELGWGIDPSRFHVFRYTLFDVTYRDTGRRDFQNLTEMYVEVSEQERVGATSQLLKLDPSEVETVTWTLIGDAIKWMKRNETLMCSVYGTNVVREGALELCRVMRLPSCPL